MKPAIVAYIPVLHRGYEEFFSRHPEASAVYILGESVIDRFESLAKDFLRALAPIRIQQIIHLLHPNLSVIVADEATLKILKDTRRPLIMPDEDISRILTRTLFRGSPVTFDNIFLRWDRRKSLRRDKVRFDRQIAFSGLVREMMERALGESTKASNWWRQVGAVIVRRRRVLLVAYNRHVPLPQMPYLEGDPRSNFKRGLHIELSTDHHAESRLIAEAARLGLSLKGADLFVTTFPCPPCAKLVAYSGIKRCYFTSGYAMLDGERVLRSQGVELVFVEKKSPHP